MLDQDLLEKLLTAQVLSLGHQIKAEREFSGSLISGNCINEAILEIEVYQKEIIKEFKSN